MIYGTTNYNNKTVSYDPVYVNGTKQSKTAAVHYNIFGLHPYLNYTFTTYIMDLFNNTKDEDHVIFCELLLYIL